MAYAFRLSINLEGVCCHPVPNPSPAEVVSSSQVTSSHFGSAAPYSFSSLPINAVEKRILGSPAAFFKSSSLKAYKDLLGLRKTNASIYSQIFLNCSSE